MNVAANPDPRSYACFSDFFIRALQDGSRPIANKQGEIASPADGSISQLGDINDGTLLQAKGVDFSVERLLAGNQNLAKTFNHGRFMTLYLSPRDYHRVHMPYTGQLREMIYVPGKLFSVNPTSTKTIDQLFARNERVICIYDTDIGPMAVIMVGALIVGSIHTRWAGTITPPRQKSICSWQYASTEAPFALSQGDELGHFTLGSTVILLFSSENVQWHPLLSADSPMKMGQLIANVLS